MKLFDRHLLVKKPPDSILYKSTITGLSPVDPEAFRRVFLQQHIKENIVVNSRSHLGITFNFPVAGSKNSSSDLPLLLSKCS